MRKYLVGAAAGALGMFLALAASSIREQLRDQSYTTED